jgi:uncharacterized membrane protein YhhN
MQSRTWLRFFLVISILHLFFIHGNFHGLPTSITKILLVPSLIGYIYFSNQKYIATKILLACIFYFLGDLFLDLLGYIQNPIFFMMGLGSFLMGHLFIIAHLSIGMNSSWNNSLKRNFFSIVALIFFILSISLNILPDVPKAFLIPVSIYLLVLGSLSVIIFLQDKKFEKNDYALACLGIVLFLISDGIIALGKFCNLQLPYSNGLWIMITYIAAISLMLRVVAKKMPQSKKIEA